MTDAYICTVAYPPHQYSCHASYTRTQLLALTPHTHSPHSHTHTHTTHRYLLNYIYPLDELIYWHLLISIQIHSTHIISPSILLIPQWTIPPAPSLTTIPSLTKEGLKTTTAAPSHRRGRFSAVTAMVDLDPTTTGGFQVQPLRGYLVVRTTLPPEAYSMSTMTTRQP